METKKYLTAITGENKALLNFISKENLFDLTIFNAKIDENENAIFETLTNFHKLEKHELNRGGQFAFELFQTFRNPKNAIASILKALETKKPITAETFKDQAKLTPKNYTDDHKKLKSFGDFWAFLEEAGRNQFSALATSYFASQELETTSFEFFYLNGSIENKELKTGDFIKIPDPVYGMKFITKVIQASPGGFVSLIDEGGILTLSKDSAEKMQIIKEKDLKPEAKEFFATATAKYTQESEILRTSAIEKGATAYFAKLSADEKATEKAEKDAKKLEISTATKAELEKTKLTTEAEITAFTKKVNTANPKLTPEHKKALSTKIENAKAKISQKIAETPKAGETPAPKATSKRQRKAPAMMATAENKPEETKKEYVTVSE